MFTLYHANQLETLKILLVHLMQSERLAHPFEPEHILVQSSGMSQWLSMALAEELGVAANLNFSLPASFIWQLFAQVLPDVPERSAFQKEAMVWKLMKLLPELLDEPEFASLKQYLDGEPMMSATDTVLQASSKQDVSKKSMSKKSILKRFQLAEKIADVFDGYLVYRPDWIQAWEAGQGVSELSEHPPWQAILWQRLYEETRALGQSHYHRGNLYQTFIEQLQAGHIRTEHLPKRLFVFGISALPPRYIDALRALGEVIDVHFMLTNPSQHYWGEIRDRTYLSRIAAMKRTPLSLTSPFASVSQHPPISPLKGSIEENEAKAFHLSSAMGNSLLASMGKLGRDMLYVLSQAEMEEFEFFTDIPRDSLLHQIQADMLHLEEHQDDQQFLSSDHKQVIETNDHSIAFHACHSAMREVEVLHDHLLHLFSKHPDLHPRDVIVMVADIDAYSPAIEAVFGNATHERLIPFSISDRVAHQETPLLQAFMTLMTLPSMRCTVSELLELLEVPAVMSRFDVTLEEFHRAKIWIEDSGIRWGLDEQTATDFDLPALRQNTWLFGIQRMLAGYAMSDDVAFMQVGETYIAPYDEVQGMTAELAGKLATYLQTIQHYRQVMRQERTIQDWRHQLHQLLDDFFELSAQDEVTCHHIRETLAQLQTQMQDANYTQVIALEVLQQTLKRTLADVRVSQRFLAGQVNFCTLMPMRSIPFQVVCLLGMNDGMYPRSVPTEGFDLMVSQHRVGDRSRRDDDRYLFLEALLSAKQQFYMSYIGRSIRDNSPALPSILVSELMEYCHQNYCLSEDRALPSDQSGQRLIAHLSTCHPMVPYSRDAFLAEQGSFAKEWLPVAQRAQPEAPLPADVFTPYDYLAEISPLHQIELDELQRFWRLPVEYFFLRRLQVVFEQSSSLMDDQEPFGLDGLTAYQMRQEIVQHLIAPHMKDALSLHEVPEGAFEGKDHDDPKAFEGAPQERLSHYFATKRAQGTLPVGAFGELTFEQHYQQAQALAEAIIPLMSTPHEDVALNVILTPCGEEKSVRLVGWVKQRYAAGLVRYRVGQIRAQDYLAAWLDHLSCHVMGEPIETHLLGIDKKVGVQHWVFPVIEEMTAGRESAVSVQAQLTEYVRLWIEGMGAPLPYFPRTALAGIEAEMNRQGESQPDEEKSLQKMKEIFIGNDFSDGEGSNPYIQRIWPDWTEALGQALRTTSALVLQAPRLGGHFL